MHTCLDGFMAGQNAEITWMNFDDKIFDFAASMADYVYFL
jgi:hypothetical protein